MAMALFATGENFAGSDVERGKESCRAVADIVVGHAFNITQTHGENGLGAVQRLNLALLIHTQDQGVLGRIEIQPDNIADFLDEKRIRGDFEMALSMRLKAKGAPDSLDRGPRDLCFFGDRAYRPMSSVDGLGFKSFADQLSDPVIGNRAGAPRPEFIVKARESLVPIAFPPQDHRWPTIAKLGGDLPISGVFGGHQYYLRPGHQAIGQGA